MKQSRDKRLKEEAYMKLLAKIKISDAQLKQLILQGWKECIDEYIIILNRGNGKSTSQLIKPFLEEKK